MSNPLDKIDSWRKLFSLLAMSTGLGFSVGVYLENWHQIGAALKMPFIGHSVDRESVPLQRFSLNSGFAASPLIENITSNEIKFKIQYFTTEAGIAYVGYNLGGGEQITEHVQIGSGNQTINSFNFSGLQCNTTYAFLPFFKNHHGLRFGNKFLAETGPCISDGIAKN